MHINSLKALIFLYTVYIVLLLPQLPVNTIINNQYAIRCIYIYIYIVNYLFISISFNL